MRSFFHIIRLNAAALFLSSCALISGPSPEGAQAVISKAQQFRMTKALGSSKETRLPLKKGQWTALMTRAKDDPNDISLQIMKVANVGAGTVTLETEMYTAASKEKRTVMQQTIRNYPIAPKVAYRQGEADAVLRGLEIVSMKIMNEDGKVEEIPQIGIPIGRIGADLLKASVATGAVRSEPCANTTIKASRCFLVPYTAKVLWMSDSGTSYSHSDVPILGSIKSSGESGETEVIGFGSSGAEILIR